MDLAVVVATFAIILPAELPDKTMVATLVLATRYRALPVWVGVAAAFLVQSLVAVTAGGLLAQLPRRPLLAVTAVLFAIGSAIMWRSAGRAAEEEAEEEEDYGRRVAARGAARGVRAMSTSFLVLFAAEWGDLSQIATAGLVVRYDDPVSVFLGAWIALACIAGLAVIGGRALLAWVPLAIVRRIAGTVFAVLALVTALEAVGAELPGPL